MLFSKFYRLRRLVFDQSSPVHPVSDSGGWSERDKWRMEDGSTEILVSNIGLLH